MYFRLAFQNVKRSIKDYLIYIMTLTACISLFYAFLSITSRYYRPDIGAEFNLEVLGDGMLLVIILITMLLIFLVQYVNRFMIRNQQKEFAVQSIMGMEQSMIAGLFFIETLVFLLTPFLVEWAQGFLDKRVVYDIQIDSDYTAAENVKLLPETDYAFLDSFFEEKHITLKDDCTFSTYFLKASDVHGQGAITAISLSDYNHLMEMFGYEEISLAENEFATQWLSITPKSTMETFETQYDRIATDNGELTLSAIEPKTEELGEVIYSNQNIVLILPDLMCDKLTVANSYRYIMTESPLSYADAEQLTDYFDEYMPMDEQEVYSVTTKTIERNDTSALIFIVQTGLIYSAIILFVICFTILSLQQLSDSGKYRYRFQVLRNMGVEENHIRRLVLKQLGIWFGVPVMVALLISSAFILFLFIGFSIQIRTYIGAWKLLQQVGTILTILFALLICYFTSTWILFRKSISQGQKGKCNV